MDLLQIMLTLTFVVMASAGEPDGDYKFEVKHPVHHVVHHEHHGGDEWAHLGEHIVEEHGHDDGAYKHVEEHYEEHHSPEEHYPDHHPSYKFEYGVKDPKTGDHKSQWEHRDGDVVKGEYTLDEADGTHRVVEYSSDKKNGFNAVVKKIGHAHHPQAHHHH